MRELIDQAKRASSWLERLGLVGFSSLEAPLLAALVTSSPLLLIGPHGTAKSLLLTRVATALGLEFRHYNASLLNFDDLVGFPLPGKDGKLQYIQTPASIWGAGAVIFDEISRCRPDIQNKLFPIIHERRVQGLLLEDLRYRWAAMNPPSTDDDENGYAGSEPLDAALADRFAFVVDMPHWAQFTPAEQLAVIQAQDRPIAPEDAAFLVSLIERTKQVLSTIETH
jgi:MoxR-like ATPase